MTVSFRSLVVRALVALLLAPADCSSGGGALDGGSGGQGGVVGPNPTSDGGITPDRPPDGGGSGGAGGTGGGPAAAAVTFPKTAPWYQDVSAARVDPQSGPVITGLAARGWGTGTVRIDFSIQVLRADASLVPRDFTRTADFYAPDCDFVPVPV